MSIFDLLTLQAQGSFATGDEDRRDFVRFVEQRLYTPAGQQLCFDRDFEPKAALVGFFFDDGRFVNEISTGFGSTQSSVIGANRATASNQLVSNGVPTAAVWNCVDKLKSSQRKFLRSRFHFVFGHPPV